MGKEPPASSLASFGLTGGTRLKVLKMALAQDSLIPNKTYLQCMLNQTTSEYDEQKNNRIPQLLVG